MKKILSLLIVLSLLSSLFVVSPVAAATTQSDTFAFDATGDFNLGNTSQNILNGGVMAFYEDNFYYADVINGGYIFRESGDSVECLNQENSKNINIVSDGTVIYSTDNMIKQITSSNVITPIYTAESEITQMYVINDNYIYFLADSKLYCYNMSTAVCSEVIGNYQVNKFIPTEYGILYSIGDLFNYTVFANQKIVVDNVVEFYVDNDLLVYMKDRVSYQVELKNVFDTYSVEDSEELAFAEDISLFALSEDAEDNLDDVEFIDESASISLSSDEYSSPIQLFSVGSDNVVKRAMQQVNIKWTPKKDVKGYSSNTSGAATTFKKGTTYKGVPYGQLVDSGVYVPHNYSLNNFISAVNDSGSKFYTKRGKYSNGSKDSPYYASDCSAFVTWAYGLSRMTTSTIADSSTIKKVSSQSIYSAKIGDCLNKRACHVVLITDLIYDSSGKLTKVTIMEQTPPKAKKATLTVSEVTKKYFNNGYVLRRYKNVDNVEYKHYCAVPLEGDNCSSCGVSGKLDAPTITEGNAKSSSSIELKWNKVNNATAYRIDRRKSTEDDYKTITKSCEKPYYTDKGLSAGSVYYYRVYALNNSTESKRSTTYKAYTAPSKPVIASINKDSDTQLTISWNKVSGATKYKLVYRRGDVEKYEIIDAKLTGTSYTHKNLKSGSRYWYRVYAIIEGEVGAEGNRSKKNIESEHSETDGKFTKISRPSNSIDNDNPSHVILSWKKTYGASNYAYAIYRQGPNESDYKKIGTTTNLTYTDKNAVSGTIYKYKIETIVSDTGNYCTKTDAFYAGPKVTQDIVLTPQDATSMKISWNKPDSKVGLKYTIKKLVNGEYVTLGTTSNTYYVDTKLTKGNTYSYYVQVRDSSDNYLTSTFVKSAVLQILPTGVSMNKSSANIVEGSTLQLQGTIKPSNSTETALTWTSSNSKVASVSSKGLVTALTEGTTRITVKTSNGKTAVCDITVAPAKCTHTFGNWVITTPATCLTDGSKTRTCSNAKCQETETEVIPATGHTYSDEWTILKESSCSEKGEKAHKCINCDSTIDNSDIDMLDHSFGDAWTVRTEATCIAEGIEYRTCSVCFTEETRSIATISHNYELTEEVETTPDGPGHRTYTCSMCKDSFTEEYIVEIKEGTVSIGASSPRPGETITVPVTLNNNPGLAGFTFVVDYDESVLTPTAITAGALLTEGTFISNLEQGIPAEELESVAVYWSNDYNITENGELFNITFKVSDTAPKGSYLVSLDYIKGDITNEEFSDVMPDVLANVITIADVIRGDVNLDRKVDSHDGILLGRYLAKWNITFTENQIQAADVFSDARLTTKDGVRLSQLLAGYEIAEEQPMAISLMSLENISFTVGSAEVTGGDYIYIPVSISNNTGLAGFDLKLTFDNNYLTPVSIIEGDMLKSGTFTSNVIQDADLSELEYVTATWIDSDNMNEDGTLFIVEFMVNDAVEVGQKLPLSLSYDTDAICNSYLADVAAIIENGAVEVVEYASEGDVTGEYVINNVIMHDVDNNEYEAIPVNGEFYVTTSFSAFTEEFTPATVFVSAYDTSDRLISLKNVDVTEEDLAVGSVKVYFDKTALAINKLKVFIWDGIGSLKPLAESVVIQ